MGWVCLMYHDVVPGVPGNGGGPDRFSVSVDAFDEMLLTIEETGHAGCSLESALARHDKPRVAITFDDGTAGQFEHAVPALRARDMTATFFVTTDWVGTPGFMTWSQLRQLTDWGMSVQSHTKSHPHLSELDRKQLTEELSVSKATLDRELGQETTQIALPGGNAPRRGLRGLLSESGYGVVATSRWGRNAEPPGSASWIRRCTAPRSPSPALRLRIVEGETKLALTKYSREAALNGVRATLGANRYARWRRRFLNALSRSPA